MINYDFLKKHKVPINAAIIRSVFKSLGIATLLSLPIIFFCFPILTSGSSFMVGDFDMQVQMTEAARISITHYHQFPFWNPWTSGGVPLFADPQFGLFTITTALALTTNAVMAWKLTFVIYMLIGFFSMKIVLKEIGLRFWPLQALLSYIYVFNSFFLIRFNGGHFTFLLLLLLPLALYLLITFQSSRHRLIQLSLLIAYLFYAAVHYSSIFILIFLGAFTFLLAAGKLLQIVIKRAPVKDFFASVEFSRIIFLAKVLAISVTISLPRLWVSLNYLRHNGPSRTNSHESFIGISDGLNALFSPYGRYSMMDSAYGIFEATNYIGGLTGIIFVVLVLLFGVNYYKNRRQVNLLNSLNKPVLMLTIIGAGAFIIGLGGYIFYVLQHFPIFSSMRVSTRYFFITAFCLLLLMGILMARYSSYKMRIVLSTLLLLASFQVLATNRHEIAVSWSNNRKLQVLNEPASNVNLSLPPEPTASRNDDDKKVDYDLVETTRIHHSQIITDNALVETRSIGSALCDKEVMCDFIEGKNAVVLYWSPNFIKLRRTGPGDITINSNIGAGWKVNGKHIFRKQLTVSSHVRLIVPASEQGVISLSYQPYYIPDKLLPNEG